MILFGGSLAPSLWALPATVENLDYKVTLSETMPGVDDQTSLQAGPTITVSVQDKVRNNGVLVPLPVYSINHYYLGTNSLNLLCRTTPRSADTAALYNLFQLDLSNSQESRQFKDLKRYSFSPDDHFLLGVFDGKGQPDSIVLVRLSEPPAQLEWIYTNKGAYNLFRKTLPDMPKKLHLNDPVTWSIDSDAAVFVISGEEDAPDPEGKPVWKDYLACVTVSDDGFKVAAEPLDLSTYHYRQGAVISKIECRADKAILYFTRDNSSDNLKAEFTLPKPPPGK